MWSKSVLSINSKRGTENKQSNLKRSFITAKACIAQIKPIPSPDTLGLTWVKSTGVIRGQPSLEFIVQVLSFQNLHSKSAILDWIQLLKNKTTNRHRQLKVLSDFPPAVCAKCTTNNSAEDLSDRIQWHQWWTFSGQSPAEGYDGQAEQRAEGWVERLDLSRGLGSS